MINDLLNCLKIKNIKKIADLKSIFKTHTYIYNSITHTYIYNSITHTYIYNSITHTYIYTIL